MPPPSTRRPGTPRPSPPRRRPPRSHPRRRRTRPRGRAADGPTPRPRTVGLTGGIGSGKSAALDAFRRRGAAVLSSDEVVHAAYADPAVVEAVRARFGADVVGGDGLVDRTALARAAFADPGGVAFLEGLVHPRVGVARERWQEEQRARRPPPPLLVCEVPLLFEAGLDDAFDAVLVVTADAGVRRRRVEARGQDFAALSGRQIPEEEKLRRADRYFVNDGPVGELEEWVAERFEEYAS